MSEANDELKKLRDANAELLRMRQQAGITEADVQGKPCVEEADFVKGLAKVWDAPVRYDALPEEQKPAQQETSTRISAILREKGFPKRHVEQLAVGLHGAGLEKANYPFPKISGGDAIILLIGNRGPGKTQIATLWAHWLIRDAQPSVRYVKCADLIGEIKATWRDGGRSVGTEQDVMRKYRKARYLVIDEFHEKGGSDWEARCLVNLIDHRYDDMLCTVIIANLSEEQARAEINPSILDRANQTGGLIVCDWPSYRV